MKTIKERRKFISVRPTKEEIRLLKAKRSDLSKFKVYYENIK